MNLRHLQTFVAVANAGGLRRAATRVNLSQPAISRQLHALEAELGVRLFDLIRRRVQLTSEGEDLLQRGRRLLSEVEAISERARALKSGQTGVLRVGATPQLIESMMVAFLAQYRKRHPDVEDLLYRVAPSGPSTSAASLRRLYNEPAQEAVHRSRGPGMVPPGSGPAGSVT